MDKYLKDLNEEQLQAVMSDNPRIRCIAGAGSGKTKVLTTRVYRLLNNRVSSNNIACLTFTRLAGLEMKERIIKMTPLGKQVFCNTYHSFGIEILRKFADRLGFDKDNFTIANREKRESLLKESAAVYNYTKNFDKISEAIADYFNKKNSISLQDKLINDIINDYIYNQKKYNIIDIDMLLYFTYILLSEYEDIREYYKEKYTHLMIDEYQDSNDIQVAIVKLIEPKNLFLVGDYRQAIYGWRGAKVEYILNFDKEYPGSETIYLNKNYRNTKPIVNAANNLVKNFLNDNSCMITQKDGPPLELLEMINEDEQNDMIAASILGLSDKYQYNDISILARSNSELENLSVKLSDYDIPFILPQKSNSFTHNYSVKALINLIEAAINPKDEKALICSLNYPKVTLKSEQLSKLKMKCLDCGISLWDGLNKFKFVNQDVVNTFIERFNNIRKYIIHVGSALKTIEYTIDLFGITSDCEMLNELLRDSEEWEKSQKEYSLAFNISSYLDYFYSKDIQDKVKIKADNENKVKLLTVHGAKGLEFPVVYILGLNNGNFPREKADKLEESRIAYVAYTRAENLLILTRYNQRKNYLNKLVNTEPSPFIMNIG